MDLHLYIEYLNKYKKNIIIIFMTCLLVTVSLIFLLPKKYKSVSVISISIKYFQNPLVKEFITESYDSQEMKNQKEALLASALTDDFLDQIALKYRIYEKDSDDKIKDIFYQRTILRSRIEIVPLSQASTQISFYSTDPKLSQSIVNELVTKIEDHLKNQRQNFLIKLRQSMKKRIDTLIANVDYSININTADEAFIANPELISKREKLKTQIDEKLKFFTDSHPSIVILKKQLIALENELEKLKKSKDKSNLNSANDLKEEFKSNDDELLYSKSEQVLKAKNSIYEDLIRKFEYLNIAIDSEKDDSSSYFSIIQKPSFPLGSIFPNKLFFLLWGVLISFFATGIFITYKELTNKLNLSKKSSSLDIDWKLNNSTLESSKAEDRKNADFDSSKDGLPL